MASAGVICGTVIDTMLSLYWKFDGSKWHRSHSVLDCQVDCPVVSTGIEACSKKITAEITEYHLIFPFIVYEMVTYEHQQMLNQIRKLLLLYTPSS